MTSISIVIKTRGLGYMIVEDNELLDWGSKRFRGEKTKNKILDYLLTLIHLGDITHIYLNEISDIRETTANLFKADIYKYLKDKKVKIKEISQTDIRFHFGNISRYELAENISKEIPQISHLLPKRKHIWESEDISMLLFDSAAQLKAQKLI